MGSKGAPPPKKRPGTAANVQNGQRAVLTEPGEKFPIPDECDQPEAVEAWDNYWNDPVSSVVTEVDHSVLIRWITMVNRYFKLMKEADESPVISTTSNGNLAHPLYKVALAMENQIERLESKLGISPSARARLGIQILGQEQAKQNLQRGQSEAPKAPAEEEDPRFM